MSRRTRIALVAAVAALSLAVAVAPASAGTLDQQQTTVDTAPFGYRPGPLPSTQSLAQTFTPELSGALDQVDLYLGRFSAIGPLTVELRDVSGGAPGSTVLASASVPPPTCPPSLRAFVAVPFASPPPVDASHQYAIVAYAGGTDLYGWPAAVGNVYLGGAPFFSSASPPTTCPFGITADLAFKTYVLEDAFELTGFFAPIDMAEPNSAKAGKAVPVKWRVPTPTATRWTTPTRPGP